MDSSYHAYITSTQGNCGEVKENFNACFVPAMAYIPFQSWGNIYSPEVGFERGTLFQVLDKPFIGEEAIPHA